MGNKNTGVLVSGTIRPNNSSDPIATAYANEIKGGHHTVANIALRDSIMIQRREIGMLCTIYDDSNNNGTYQLKSLPNEWVPFAGSGGSSQSTWLDSSIDIVNVLPSSPTVGERYLANKIVSGNLSGNANKVVEYTSNGWVYSTPINGNMMVLKAQSNTIYRYNGDFPSGRWIKHVIGGISIKNHLIDEVIEVPNDYQYFVYGDLIIEDAHLINYGEVVTLNGDLIILGSGKFSNYGEYLSPKTEKNKYSNQIITVANIPSVITHNMNTYDVIVAVYVNGVPSVFNMEISSNNTITITTTTSISGRITIIA